MSSLTKEMMFVVTRLGDFTVDKVRADNITQIRLDDPTGAISIDGSLVACNQIDGILNSKQYEIYMLKKRGGWQCKYSHWHEKYQQCAHMSYNKEK